MARRLRIDHSGAIHHVMNRGVDHQPIFFADVDRVRFGELLADVHERFGVETLAYCLMGNHYHLLLRTPTGQISEAMRRLGGLYTQHANSRLGRDGPIFRGRFHSKLVTTDSYLLWLTRYIHRNPLDLDGVRDPAGYRWSSYRSYLGLRGVAPFLDLDTVLSMFEHDPSAMQAFTESDAVAVDGLNENAVDDLVQLAELVVGRHQLESTTHAAEPWMVRTLLILLSSDPRCGELRTGLDERLGYRDATARRRSITRARRRAEAEPTVTQLLAAVSASIADSATAA